MKILRSSVQQSATARMRRFVGNWCVKEMTISGDAYLETKGVVDMLAKRLWMLGSVPLVLVLFSSALAVCQTPSPALLVLEKEDKSLAIVDPGTLKIVGRVPAGEDPHEVVVNQDGSRAYISNYGGFKTPRRLFPLWICRRKSRCRQSILDR